ncbi:unnamed protein product [Soboliphyme baturini]|uniref:C2 domain-containing protein n=1 Tax=Soboliphyme baturini TaxID=241478 RepID=A0A183IFP2_9BILA|nr:unnamed protein product [Soboliphyme baturini]
MLTLLRNVGKLGEVFLSLSYDVGTECVTVQIFAARDVAQASVAARYYLRILIVVGTRIVKVKSSSISSTVYGVFNYCRSFRIPFQMLNSCCLKFEIVGIRQDDSEEVWGRVIVGSCRYTVGKGVEHWMQMSASEGRTVEMWHDILYFLPNRIPDRQMRHPRRFD